MAEQQQPVHIPTTDAPFNGRVSVPATLTGAFTEPEEVKPQHLHAPEGGPPPTVEQERAYYQAAEADILATLFGAIDDAQTAVVACTFPRFQFPVRDDRGAPVIQNGEPLTEPMKVRFTKQRDEDIEAANRRATAWVPNPDVPGGPRVERVNQAKMRCWIIYNATVPEDRASYWDRKELVSKLRVGNGVEVIEKLLTAGEKLQAVNAIYGHSGLMRTESEVEQVAKQSGSVDAD